MGATRPRRAKLSRAGQAGVAVPGNRKALLPLCSPGTWRTPSAEPSSRSSDSTSICNEGSTPNPATDPESAVTLAADTATSRTLPPLPPLPAPAAARGPGHRRRESSPAPFSDALPAGPASTYLAPGRGEGRACSSGCRTPWYNDALSP